MDSIEYEALRRAQEIQRVQSTNQNRNQGHNQNKTPNQARTQSDNHSARETPQKNADTRHNRENNQGSVTHKTSASSQPQFSVPVQPAKGQSQNSDLLSTLFEDKEKLLILALILILSSEDCEDPALILALLYLII